MENFDSLYAEYKKLKASTHREAQILKIGQPYKVHHISHDEFMRRKALAKELVKNYEKYFDGKHEEWFDLKKDAI